MDNELNKICVESFKTLLQSYVDTTLSAEFYHRLNYKTDIDIYFYSQYKELAENIKNQLIELYTTALEI